MVELNREKLLKESEAEALRQLDHLTIAKNVASTEERTRIEEFLRTYARKKLGEARNDYEYHKEKCPRCGRKILVQIVLDGSNHNASVSVICAECLAKTGVGKQFKEERPEATKDIENWLADKPH